jgi:hypothetical protein
MLLERVTKDLKRSPTTSTSREMPRPATAPPPGPAPVAPAAPRPPMQAAPSSPASASPFTTTRGEFGTQHPAAERAERTAAAPPPMRTMQRETPGTPSVGGDAGFFQRDITLPGDTRTPAAASVTTTARATTTPSSPLVVPITLDGSVREIVLRIVIEQVERVEPRR